MVRLRAHTFASVRKVLLGVATLWLHLLPELRNDLHSVVSW